MLARFLRTLMLDFFQGQVLILERQVAWTFAPFGTLTTRSTLRKAPALATMPPIWTFGNGFSFFGLGLGLTGGLAFAAITAVRADVAVLAPALLMAVTVTRRRLPMSADEMM